MTTLRIRRARGHDPFAWAVTDGQTVIATARSNLTRSELDIDRGGRRFTARMAGSWRQAKQVEVLDAATGETLIDGNVVRGGPGPRDAEWALRLPNGNTISWFYQGEPRKLGFYDSTGAPIILTGHDASFEAPKQGGTLRILLRIWTTAIASSGRYVAQVMDDAVGRVVQAGDVPILALLGMWLQQAAEADTESSGMPA